MKSVNSKKIIRHLIALKMLCLLSFSIAQDVYADKSAKENIKIQCGASIWTITCGRDNSFEVQDSRHCSHNKLSLTDSKGKVTVIPDPPLSNEFHDDKRPVMLKGTTPTAISCLTKGGEFFISVYYARDGSERGAFYEWFEGNGKRMSLAGSFVNKDTKSPAEGISWKKLPKEIFIEEQP